MGGVYGGGEGGTIVVLLLAMAGNLSKGITLTSCGRKYGKKNGYEARRKVRASN
jgi:hypothetical protein